MHHSVTVALVAALASGLAAAQDGDVAAARRHFRRASELFEAGDHRAAHDEYERAYAAAPLPDLLFDMAQCQRSMGDHARARDLYRRFLATHPAPDKRAVAEQLLRDVEARIAETAAPAPSRSPVVLASPRSPLPAPAAPRPPGPSGADDSAPGTWRLAWILAGAGAVALGGAGLYFGLEVGRAQDALDDPTLDCSVEIARCLEVADAGREASVLRDVSLAASAFALVGAAVLLVVDLSSARPERLEHARVPGAWTW